MTAYAQIKDSVLKNERSALKLTIKNGGAVFFIADSDTDAALWMSVLTERLREDKVKDMVRGIPKLCSCSDPSRPRHIHKVQCSFARVIFILHASARTLGGMYDKKSNQRQCRFLHRILCLQAKKKGKSSAKKVETAKFTSSTPSYMGQLAEIEKSFSGSTALDQGSSSSSSSSSTRKPEFVNVRCTHIYTYACMKMNLRL